MSELFLDEDESNTPLTREESEQLIPSYITLRAELNHAEHTNIANAMQWLGVARNLNLLDESSLKEIHKKMFCDVWRWAGSYRTTARNIGIEAYLIPTAIRQLIDDVKYWIEHGTYPPDEIAIRYSHRLVKIHPFPNGNGRFSRFLGDLLAEQLGQAKFTWGRNNLINPETTRRDYINALRAADGGDIQALLQFAKS